jgi:hypothetical protein
VCVIAWCVSWIIFFKSRILKEHLELVKLLEMHFRLRFLLSWATLYANYRTTETFVCFINLLPFVHSPGERSV